MIKTYSVGRLKVIWTFESRDSILFSDVKLPVIKTTEYFTF